MVRASDDKSQAFEQLANGAHLLSLVGAAAEARSLWAEALSTIASSSMEGLDDIWVLFAFAAVHLHAEAEAAAVVAPSANVWGTAAQAILEHDFARAASMLRELGDVTDAALADMYAGGENASRALEFFRSVGAIRYINAIEAGEYG
jgi:hypothetical protein